MELDSLTFEKVTLLTSSGDELVEEGQLNKALIQYKEALSLIPIPKENWEASIWIFTAIGDVYFFKDDFEEALSCFLESLKCDGGIDNPFVQLRLGQCFFELNNLAKAQDYLLRAYMLSGDEIFNNEDEKYQKILK